MDVLSFLNADLVQKLSTRWNEFALPSPGASGQWSNSGAGSVVRWWGTCLGHRVERAPKSQRSRPRVFQCSLLKYKTPCKKKKNPWQTNIKISNKKITVTVLYRTTLICAKEKIVILILPLFKIYHSVYHWICAFFKKKIVLKYDRDYWALQYLLKWSDTCDRSLPFLTLVPVKETRVMCLWAPWAL